MTRKSASIAAVAVASAALAAPAGAGAASLETGVKSVKAHTTKADKALDRAVALYGRNRDRDAGKQFGLSRKEIAKADRVAAALARKAGDGPERAAAARARVLVADQQDENDEQLVGVLDEADGHVESKIAQAALGDTRGRDKALAILSALVDRVPSRAQAGLSRAVVALSTDRAQEIGVEAEALASEDVSAAAKGQLAQAVQANVEGQQAAANRLAELISRSDMPEAAKAGLTTAYDAVTAEHEAAAQTLAGFSGRMPAEVRAFVEQVAAQAPQSAQTMRSSRPSPPSQGSRPGVPGR